MPSLITNYQKSPQNNAFLNQRLADVAGWLWNKPQAEPDILDLLLNGGGLHRAYGVVYGDA